MNEHDSERTRGMLDSLGYEEVDARAEADLILFNTCSIRESADNRFIAHLGRGQAAQIRGPERVVAWGAAGRSRSSTRSSSASRSSTSPSGRVRSGAWQSF